MFCKEETQDHTWRRQQEGDRSCLQTGGLHTDPKEQPKPLNMDRVACKLVSLSASGLGRPPPYDDRRRTWVVTQGDSDGRERNAALPGEALKDLSLKGHP